MYGGVRVTRLSNIFNLIKNPDATLDDLKKLIDLAPSKLNDMKTQLILLFGLIILFIAPKQSICRELNSINFEVKRNYKFNNFNQDTTLVFDAFIGKYPKFYGLIKALDSIENTINKILQGGVPYKVFSSVNNIPQETYSIKNGVFTYKIILNRCGNLE